MAFAFGNFGLVGVQVQDVQFTEGIQHQGFRCASLPAPPVLKSVDAACSLG